MQFTDCICYNTDNNQVNIIKKENIRKKKIMNATPLIKCAHNKSNGIEFMQHEHEHGSYNYCYYGYDCAEHMYALFDLKHKKCDTDS